MTVFDKSTYAKIIFSLDDINDENSFSFYHYDSRPDNRPIIVSDLSEFKSWVAKLNPALKLFLVIHIGAESHEIKAKEKEGKFLKYSCETFIKSIQESYPNIQFVLASREPKPEDETYFSSKYTAKLWKADDVFDLNDNHPTQFVKDLFASDKNYVPIESPKPLNFAILSALTDDELKPFRNAMTISKRNGYEECVYKFGEYQTNLLLYAQNRMAMVDASIFTSKVINQANPKAIVMAGVCGGRKSEKVKLYDIIIPELALDIVTGQYKNGDFIPYGYSAKSDEEFIKYIKGIVAEKDFILKEMYNLIPNEKHDRENEILKNITIHFDVMACGPFVLKTDNFLEKKALQMNHKIKGFEMESYAVLRSMELLAKDRLSLIVKSVMDYTDSKKGDTISETVSGGDNDVSEEAKSEVPKGENIKAMAAYMSSICTRTLLPHIEKYIDDNKI